MSQHHPPHDRLEAFVLGDLAQEEAIELALHLDSCAACATCAATLDPLAAAFAAVDDPVPPPALLEALVAQARAPARLGPEPAIAAALLGAGTLLLFVAGGPAQTLAGIGATSRALVTVVEAVVAQGGGGILLAWAGMAALLLAASVITARALEGRLADSGRAA